MIAAFACLCVSVCLCSIFGIRVYWCRTVRRLLFLLFFFMQVNEIYRDLANMVEQQQEAVEQIEGNTEGAHARAQEGLVQVCMPS